MKSHEWKWTGKKKKGYFEFVCDGCKTSVGSTGPPWLNDGNIIILRGFSTQITSISVDCDEQAVANIIEEEYV